MPRVDWQTGLPEFQVKKGDDVVVHLIRFCLHVHTLMIDFPEDCLMKMFLGTLEENARFLYESRLPASIRSLKVFYSAFCKRYNKDHPSLELIENLCGNFRVLCYT